jgi:hypothetical protein
VLFVVDTGEGGANILLAHRGRVIRLFSNGVRARR